MKTFFREYSLITAFILLAMIGYVQFGEQKQALFAYTLALVQRPFAALIDDEAASKNPVQDRRRQPPPVAAQDTPPAEKTPEVRTEFVVVSVAVAQTEDQHVVLHNLPPERPLETRTGLMLMSVKAPAPEPTKLTSPTLREASTPAVAEETVEFPNIPSSLTPSITMRRPSVRRAHAFGRRGVSRGRRG